MKLQKHATLPTLLGALALSLTLALTGCGQSSADADKAETTEDATTEESTDQSADTTEDATDETAAPDELAATTKATIDSFDPSKTEGAEDFESLPKSDEEEIDVSVNDLGESEDEEEVNKARSGWSTWYKGGIHMDLPSDWKSEYDSEDDTWSFMSPDGKILCMLSSEWKKSGTRYDVEAIAKSYPIEFERAGFSNTKIMSTDTLYSEAYNTLCGAQIIYTNQLKGSEFLNLCEIIESKNYINTIYFLGETADMRSYADTIVEALETVEFTSGEAI